MRVGCAIRREVEAVNKGPWLKDEASWEWEVEVGDPRSTRILEEESGG